MSKYELKVAELFSGAGGLSLGFVLANHDKIKFCPVLAIDNDAKSLDSYKTNMSWISQNAPEVMATIPASFKRDVEKLNVTAVLRMLKLHKEELDLLIGGPPCQGFSNSNRRGKAKSKSDRNKLINVFLDKLDEFRPKMFLIENVQGVQWTEPTEDMNVVPVQESLFPDVENKPNNVQNFLIQRAKSLEYYVWYSVLDAVKFGVPQHRMRFFLFGVRADLVQNKNLVNLSSYLQKLMSDKYISVIEAIGDTYYQNKNEYVEKMRRYISSRNLYDHVTTAHADYVIERYKKIPEGSNWKAIRDEMSNYKLVDNTHSNIYRRLLGNQPAITISHYRKSMLIHPQQHRGLSFREACRLQSFPDWFRFQGTNNDRQQQLANAVPPLMASAVANAIGDLWMSIIQQNLETMTENHNELEMALD